MRGEHQEADFAPIAQEPRPHLMRSNKARRKRRPAPNLDTAVVTMRNHQDLQAQITREPASFEFPRRTCSEVLPLSSGQLAFRSRGPHRAMPHRSQAL